MLVVNLTGKAFSTAAEGLTSERARSAVSAQIPQRKQPFLGKTVCLQPKLHEKRGLNTTSVMISFNKAEQIFDT